MSRRDFLRQLGHYASLGAASRMALPLSLLGSAAAEAATDYKAVVCIFLSGGNDYGNTVVPYDNASYATYQGLRSSIALSQASVAATALTPRNTLAGGLQFALAPELAPLKPLFDAGQLSVMLNIGALVAPITRTQYLARSVPVPPRLFSHLDQQKFNQSLIDDQASGWGGRIEDLLMSSNSQAAFSAISAAGNALYLTGRNAVQYQVSSNGATAISGLGKSIFGSTAVGTALQSLITAGSSNLLEDQLGAMARRSISAQSLMSAALGTTSPFASLFPANNGLAAQLHVVARIINAHATLGAGRQVFMVNLGGFDTHDHISTVHPALMATLANAMSAFHAATTQMGLAANVVSFTTSDFGRTLTSNGDGTDHGWGSHHFLMGDAIQGGQILGTPPALANNGPDDVGQGRLIPTTSWDELAAGLGTWMGAGSTALAGVLPNLANFGGAGPVFF